jgi:heat-inducible transcriptional repressor
LEQLGFIASPHTSAGRIPTDKGYRLFVDRLGDVKPLSTAEKSAIEGFLATATDLDDVVERAARQLAQLTNSLALVQYPSLAQGSVRHIELMPIGTQRVLLMLISDSGRIQQIQIDAGQEIDDSLIQELRGRLNGMLVGSKLSEVKQKLASVSGEFATERRGFVQLALDSLQSLVEDNKQEKLVVSGSANLVKQGGDFSGDLSSVLEAIEEQVVLLRLLNELQADQHGVALRIGNEIGVDGLSHASLVVTGYENRGSEVAKLGVMGPTRMDYSGNIASVRAVARYLTRILEGNA